MDLHSNLAVIGSSLPPQAARVLAALHHKYSASYTDGSGAGLDWLVELHFQDLLDWFNWFMAARVLPITKVRQPPSWPRSWATSAFSCCIPTGMHGPACVFWTNLTAFSLDSVAVLVGRLAAGGLVVGDNRRLRVLTFYSAQVCGASRNTGPRRKLYRVDSNCEAWPRNLTENPY